MGLLDPSGAALPLRLAGEAEGPSTRVLEIDQAEQRFTFEGVTAEPVA
jgi:aminopeptidase N